jgi:hypothetical protein
MLSLPPQWDYSIAGLSAICQEGKTAIRSCLKELEENYYLIRERRNNEKGYFVYEYILKEIPEPPHIENLYTEEEYTDKAHADEVRAAAENTENRTQINKEELNKKELKKDILNKERVRGITPLEAYEILNELINDRELKELYLEYIQMRDEIEVPLTKRSLKMLIVRCERLSNFNVGLQKTMLESALINQWKSVYPPAADDKERNAVKENFTRNLYNN